MKLFYKHSDGRPLCSAVLREMERDKRNSGHNWEWDDEFQRAIAEGWAILREEQRQGSIPAKDSSTLNPNKPDVLTRAGLEAMMNDVRYYGNATQRDPAYIQKIQDDWKKLTDAEAANAAFDEHESANYLASKTTTPEKKSGLLD